MVRRGLVRQGYVWQGRVWFGGVRRRMVGLGLVRHGLARREAFWPPEFKERFGWKRNLTKKLRRLKRRVQF